MSDVVQRLWGFCLQSRFTNPVNLKKLVSLIDETEWTSLGWT